MNKEWNKLRCFDGSQEKAFEELVCQLARAEKDDNRESFFRIAAPDGGVEAYSVQKDGSEYGWQAKFFFSLGKTQWSQIEESFKTALEKHPKLVKYIMCIPLDRPDPRITVTKGKRAGKSNKSLMDCWNEKVAFWKNFAKKQGRIVDIIFWGNSEIFDRLSQEKNRGRKYFWFNEESFSREWFADRLEQSIANLGKRYTPELNVDLPIAETFDGLSGGSFFYKHFYECINQVLSNRDKINCKDYPEDIELQRKEISCKIDKLFDILGTNNRLSIECVEKSKKILKDLHQEILKFYELVVGQSDLNKRFAYLESSISEYAITIFESLKYFDSDSYKLFLNPNMLLIGDAGTGKSHLLADIAMKRLDKKAYTLLFLGNQFNDNDLWSQILNKLSINCTRDEFLGALDSLADSCNERILFFFDALNECDYHNFWNRNISGFIASIRKYKNLGVAFSIRSSYRRKILTSNLEEACNFVEVQHRGFSGVEYDAVSLYFQKYEIEMPSMQMLNLEFSNPLFLMLFCEGLKKSGFHKIPEGYYGLTDVFSVYLNNANNAICNKLDIDFNYPLVENILSAIANEKLNKKTQLSIEIVHEIISNCVQNLSKESSAIYKELISENLLYEYCDNEGQVNADFAFERYYDIIVAKMLLNEGLSEHSDIKQAFKKSKKINRITDQGIINAIAILLPDLYNTEYIDVVPEKKMYYVKNAFLYSLKWRKKENIKSNKIYNYIKKEIIPDEDFYECFLELLLLLSSEPNHPLNSLYLHQYLWNLSMAKRDAKWSTYIHDIYDDVHEENNIVRVLIEWGEKHSLEYLSKESIRLYSQTLMWFLTNSNRQLRDRATKSLIRVLNKHIDILCSLIDMFTDVNDPYVVQRLYAVAFGCAVRCVKDEDLLMLCDKVYRKVFSTQKVYADILLRDYAKNVIEYGKFRNLKFDFDMSKIYGPFKSSLPNILPTREAIKKMIVPYEECVKDCRKNGINQIIKSMATVDHMPYGDFGRYTWENAFDCWNVDIHGLSNYAIKMIFDEYGYDYTLHGAFDDSVGSSDRQQSQIERIGKKYQWIAFFNLLARVADNCEVKRNVYDCANHEVKYVGTFEPYVRDIDPTILLTKSIKEGPSERLDKSFWDEDNLSWIKSKSNLPNPVRFICRKDNNGKEWLSLGETLFFKQPLKLGEKPFYIGKKDFYYMLKAYIVKKSESSKIKKWAKNKNFFGRWMPENSECFEVYDKEYYWSDAFHSVYGSDLWEDLVDESTVVGQVGITNYHYFWENEQDFSKENTLSYLKPSKLLYDILKIGPSEYDGKYTNQMGEIICVDPSVDGKGNSSLLVRKEDLLNALNENNLDIFWTVLGEKNIHQKNDDEYIEGQVISGIAYFDKNKRKLKTEMNFFKR
ncbi:ATP-binding protein [Candidatus Saccharibacteria bacterium]|nr:ATP-binding protein [Candidatus Saccharibacteria bacterium]